MKDLNKLSNYFKNYSLIEIKVMYDSLKEDEKEILNLKFSLNNKDINNIFYKHLLPKMKKILTRKSNKIKSLKKLLESDINPYYKYILTSIEFEVLLDEFSLKEAFIFLTNKYNLELDYSILNLLNIKNYYKNSI